MRNWSVAGSIGRHFARSGTLLQPVYLREFMPEFQRRLFGHQATYFQGIALRAKSEWALTQQDFPTGTWPAAQALMWWNDVVPGMNGAAEAAAQLPTDAVVWHYHPLGFMAWLNGVTWRSEWPKYRITDAAGAQVPAPARPPARR
ncbi:MAG TPA: hypothetical protein VF550_03500 [Polyangia bacterium]